MYDVTKDPTAPQDLADTLGFEVRERGGQFYYMLTAEAALSLLPAYGPAPVGPYASAQDALLACTGQQGG